MNESLEEEYLKNNNYKNIRGSDKIYGESIYTNRFELFGKYVFNYYSSEFTLSLILFMKFSSKF